MRVLAVVAVFLVAFLVRWATINSLTGDDHYLLWVATGFLKGDRPFRDFVDLGAPLYWAMTTLAQALSGYRIIGEVALGTTLVALAFAVSFQLAWRASGSLALAMVLTAFGLMIVTQRELYNYTKIFIYPLAVWLCWRYIDRPTPLRAVVLACGVAVAWGYRHDHGAYTGVGAAATLLAAHWREGSRRVIHACVVFGVALLTLLAPYLALMQVNEGIVHYIQERVHFARVVDATSRRSVSFGVHSDAPAYWFKIDPPPAARVFVEWKPEVTPTTRLALEKQYSLTNGVDPKKTLYEYFLTDVSPDNRRVLATDARIVDRRGLEDAPSAARAIVSIQWDADLSDNERASLEQQYGLLDYRSKWEYALADVNRENIGRIVQDPRVADTGLIERDTYRPMDESWLIRAQRAIPLFRISVAPRYWYPENAGIALHYVWLALPYVMLIMLVADRIRGRRRDYMPHAPEKMFAAAVMMAVANQALLRREGYFADHVAVAAILGACVWGFAFAGGQVRGRAVGRIVSGAVAAIVLVVVTFATMTYASPLAVAAATGMDDGGIWRKSVGLARTYSTSPPIDAYAPPGTTGDRGLIRYVYECTRPDDRIWVLSDLFTLPYYAERAVVGHIYWRAGLAANPEFERRMIDKVDKAEVPLVIALAGAAPLEFLGAYPQVREYVARRYTRHYMVPSEGGGPGDVFWISTDRRRQQTGTYQPLDLPCFK